jgi:transposase InsO family protein
MGCTSPSS